MTRPCSGTSAIGNPSRARSGNVLVSRIGEVAAGDLARAFQQMTDQRALSERGQSCRSASRTHGQRRQEQRRIGNAPGDHDVARRRQRFHDRFGTEICIRGDQPLAAAPDRLAGFRDRIVAVRRSRRSTSSPVTAAISRPRNPSVCRAHAQRCRRRRSGLAAPMLVTILMPFVATDRQHRSMRSLEQRVVAACRVLALALAAPARWCARRGTRTPDSRVSPCSASSTAGSMRSPE